MPWGEIETLDRGDGVRLAYESSHGRAPTLVWLSGFKSDMAGTKAEALARWARAKGQSFLRLDYSGHGRSEGAFEDGTIGRWLDDALAVINAASRGPLVLVGSSMGGWLALLVAKARPARVKGLVLIAPAADFTEELLWAGLPNEAQREIEETGRWSRPSAYNAQPYVITRRLIEEGRTHLLLGGPIAFAGPVRILQGQRDPDVPHQHAQLLADRLTTDDLAFTLIRDGDHRLSRPQDIAKLIGAVEELTSL
jgi:pimeloyl-ACP methyl ester carboxylesterase